MAMIMKESSAEKQLAKFMARYSPEIVAIAEDALKRMRKRLPGAIEMVYDNYNALVIGFGPTERASEAIFSIALYPRWVTLFFLEGVGLPDPEKLLMGSGKQVRSIVLKSPSMLDLPAVQTLMKHALNRSEKKIDSKSPGRIVIKSISPKQRPRRYIAKA